MRDLSGPNPKGLIFENDPELLFTPLGPAIGAVPPALLVTVGRQHRHRPGKRGTGRANAVSPSLRVSKLWKGLLHSISLEASKVHSSVKA